MARLAAKVLLADVVLLIIEYFIISDIQWKVSYAASPHASVSGYAPSFSYSVFTQVFTMSGGPIPLVSPVSLDWTQIIGAILLVINLLLIRDLLKANKGQKTSAVIRQDPMR